MIYFLIIVYMALLPATIILALIKILDVVYELKQEETTEKPEEKESSIQKRRTHKKIALSNYGSSFSKRTNNTYDYSEYKNQKGLYEPVQPHRGIKLSENHEKEE